MEAERGGRPRGLRRDLRDSREDAAAEAVAVAASPLCLLRLSGVIEGEVDLGGKDDVDAAAPKPPPPPMIKDALSFFGDNIPGT